MIHNYRVYQVLDVYTISDLVEKLADHTWTLCTAFQIETQSSPTKVLVFCNDSFSEDSAQEYAVLCRYDDGIYHQIESFTVSWCPSATEGGDNFSCGRKPYLG